MRQRETQRETPAQARRREARQIRATIRALEEALATGVYQTEASRRSATETLARKRRELEAHRAFVARAAGGEEEQDGEEDGPAATHPAGDDGDPRVRARGAEAAAGVGDDLGGPEAVAGEGPGGGLSEVRGGGEG